MIELPSNSLPKRKWVPLECALSWLLFDRPLELAELLDFARSKSWSDDDLFARLDIEWGKLADYASDGSVRIRARQRDGGPDIELTTDDLRNFTHAGWFRGEQLFLSLDRFPFTFTGAFRQRARGVKDGFDEPVVWRADLEKYKRIRSRSRKSPRNKAIYDDAEAWLTKELLRLEPQTGLRLHYLEELQRRFDLPKYRAQEIWTKVASSLGWPAGGRPRKTSEQKPLDETAPVGILSASDN
jgi:hypothetical protein